MIIRWAPWQVVTGETGTRPGVSGGTDVLRRFAVPTYHPAFWIGLAGAAVAAELAVLWPVVAGDEPAPGYRIAFRLVGGAFVACGIVAWRRRPDSLSGALMVATGFGLFVEPIFAQFDPPALQA